MESNQELISILIPCYNGSKYISNCIISCINQTYKNIEIIVINDGSTDDSLIKLKQWKKTDNRIKIYSQANHGLAYCRNKLIKLANGKYFTFLDIDDWIPKDAIEIFIKNSDNFKNDVIVGRSKLSFEDSRLSIPFIPSWRHVKNISNGHYVKSNICTPWASLIKKEFFNNLDIHFINNRIYEDIGVMTYVYLKSNNFKAVKNIVYYYFKHNHTNISKQKQLSSFDSQCFRKINDLYCQTDQILTYLGKEELFNNHEYKRYINGLFFQIIPSNIFLTTNYTKDKQIKYLLRYNLIKSIHERKYHLRFTKTFWKTVTYFYILFNDQKEFNDVKNDYFHRNLIFGDCINSIENIKKYKYHIISLNHNEYNKIFNKKPNYKQIYEINLNYINDNFIDEIKSGMYLMLKNNDNLEKKLELYLKNFYHKNLILFLEIDTSFNYKKLTTYNEAFVGYVINVKDNDNKAKLLKLINRINNNKLNNRLAIIKINKKHPLLSALKNKVDRIYYK